ncbi:hypothetical protein VKS41_000468 [Umbelopsis sp. WA50703]
MGKTREVVSSDDSDMEEASSSFRPPDVFKLANSHHASSFDHDELNDDDKEIWLIRLPHNISPSELTGMKFKLPAERSPGKSLGKLTAHSSSYSLYRVPEQLEETDENILCGGQEMSGFRCLVPYMKRKGKLGFAPKPIKHQLILDEKVEIPDPTEIGEQIKNTPWPIREQPEGMKMRFKPYGFDTGDSVSAASAEPSKEKKKKDKKRSHEDSSEKKSHKKKKTSS